jgi:CheY-like chemotaxis protein
MSKKKVLIVDDDPTILTLLETRLRAQGYEVQSAPNGLEALKKTEAWMPDIISLDMMMPVMNGYEACQKLKKNPKTSHIPVIVITAFEELGVKCLELGAFELMMKPFDMKELAALIRRALEQQDAA